MNQHSPKKKHTIKMNQEEVTFIVREDMLLQNKLLNEAVSNKRNTNDYLVNLMQKKKVGR